MRSSAANESNATDDIYYSKHIIRRLSAEVLLDAMSQVTGAPTAFSGYPTGTRALQLPDTQVKSEFLASFGRPARILRNTAGHGSVVFRRIASHWPHILRELGMQPFDVGAAQVRMVASNDGDLVHLHSDNVPKPVRSRVISFVYFCHREPKAFRGGLLRIHASAWKQMFDSYLRELADRAGEPFVPFVTDYVWGVLRQAGEPESVHLASWPAFDAALVAELRARVFAPCVI